MRCFYHPDYYFPLPAVHPFPMDKFWRSEALIRQSAPEIEIAAPEPAAWETVLRVHTRDYLDRIAAGTLDSADGLRLGLPAGAALLERSRLEVGGTLAATRAALAHGITANLAGGTHHAFPDRGLGYCVLNDVAIAIREVQAGCPTLRCLVVDTDAHQGNGTHAIFADDPRVFTYSIHGGRNYPAAKVPGSLDIELPRFADGATYLDALEASLGSAIEEARPDLVFWIGGADVHVDDRFGQMRLSDDDIRDRDAHVLALCAGRHPLVVLYGGGYNRDREHTARIHAGTVLQAARFERERGSRGNIRFRQPSLSA